jgi:hypothetical protein
LELDRRYSDITQDPSLQHRDMIGLKGKVDVMVEGKLTAAANKTGPCQTHVRETLSRLQSNIFTTSVDRLLFHHQFIK